MSSYRRLQEMEMSRTSIAGMASLLVLVAGCEPGRAAADSGFRRIRSSSYGVDPFPEPAAWEAYTHAMSDAFLRLDARRPLDRRHDRRRHQRDQPRVPFGWRIIRQHKLRATTSRRLPGLVRHARGERLPPGASQALPTFRRSSTWSWNDTDTTPASSVSGWTSSGSGT